MNVCAVNVTEAYMFDELYTSPYMINRNDNIISLFK